MGEATSKDPRPEMMSRQRQYNADLALRVAAGECRCGGPVGDHFYHDSVTARAVCKCCLMLSVDANEHVAQSREMTKARMTGMGAAEAMEILRGDG